MRTKKGGFEGEAAPCDNAGSGDEALALMLGGSSLKSSKTRSLYIMLLCALPLVYSSETGAAPDYVKQL